MCVRAGMCALEVAGCVLIVVVAHTCAYVRTMSTERTNSPLHLCGSVSARACARAPGQ